MDTNDTRYQYANLQMMFEFGHAFETLQLIPWCGLSEFLWIYTSPRIKTSFEDENLLLSVYLYAKATVYPITVFPPTNYIRDCIRFFAFFNSISANDCLCTASGPSAMRSVRSPTRALAKGKSPLTPAPPKIYDMERRSIVVVNGFECSYQGRLFTVFA